MTYLLLILTGIITALQIDNLKASPINTKAWITLGFLAIAIFISFIIETNRKWEEGKEKKKNDSLADLRVSKSNKLILDGIGEAIGKYSLGYDSAKREIAKLKQLIKDSANRKTIIIQGDNPYVSFCNNTGITLDYSRNDSIAFTVRVCSFSGGSIVKNLNVYSLSSNFQSEDIFKDLVFVPGRSLLTNKIEIANGGNIEGQYIFHDHTNNIKSIVILLQGSFTDSYGKNFQSLDKVALFDLVTEKYGIMTAPYDDQVRELLKTKGVIK